MMLNKRILILGGVAVLVLVGIAAGAYFVWEHFFKQEVSFEEPVDVVHDFYQPWLEAVQAGVDPYALGLADAPILGRELRTQLKEAQKSPEGLDPVLCQSVIPARIATRGVSGTEEQIEILVTARQSESTEQALVTLRARNGGWYIDDIRCSPGEFGPEREFSFDREGQLLKNVPPPLNATYWHLIFEENGQPGHFAPLLFSTESVCETRDGKSASCDPSAFKETAYVHVYGQMTEMGVNVTRMTFTR